MLIRYLLENTKNVKIYCSNRFFYDFRGIYGVGPSL